MVFLWFSKAPHSIQPHLVEGMALIDLEIQNLSTRQSDHHLKTEKLLTQQQKKTLVGVSTDVGNEWFIMENNGTS